MKNLAKLAVLALFVGLLAPSAVEGAQVDPNTWKKDTRVGPFYGRSDGIYWRDASPQSRTPEVFLNGNVSFPLGGPAYYIDFTGYTDGEGALCESVFAQGDFGFEVQDNAGAACDATCGNNACIIGLDSDGTANGTNFETCGSGDSDTCLCARTGLDIWGVCGADWEAGALGVTKVHLQSGHSVASIALLDQAIGVDMDADGLDIGSDQTNNDGVEMIGGGLYGTTGRPMFPGVDPAFRFCATVIIEDLSGTDEFWVGWRDNVGGPNATFNAYNSYAVVGVDNTTGDIHVETEDDGVGTTTTDIAVSAWVESEATEFCSLVSADGVVTHTVDGDSDAAEPSYTLDNGEAVYPFIHYLHAGDVADEIIIESWEVSYR